MTGRRRERPPLLHVEDLPPDHDWQAAQDRVDAAERRKIDAVWRRKQDRRKFKRRKGNG